MAEQGRDLLLKLTNDDSPETFTTVGGLTSVSVAGANGTVDITSFDDDGVRKLLSGKYGLAYTVSASGVAPDTAAFAAIRTAFNAGTPKNFQIDNPAATGGATYEASWIITAFEETGETDGYLTYSITLESADTVTIS